MPKVYFVVMFCVMVATIPEVHSVKLSLNFDPCPLNVTGNNHCAAAALENALKNYPHGSKEIGVLPLDPMQVTEIVMEMNTNVVNGTFAVRNMSIHGISNTRITDFERVGDKGYSFKFISETPVMTFVGPYTVEGIAVNLYLRSKGQCANKLLNLYTVHHLTGELYKKRKGKRYFRCTEYKTELATERFVPNMTNLANGDLELEELYNNIMTDNADIIFEVAKYSLADGLSIIYMETLNNFLKRIPIDKLFIVD